MYAQKEAGRSHKKLVTVVSLIWMLIACTEQNLAPIEQQIEKQARATDLRFGTRFTEAESKHFKPPTFTRITDFHQLKGSVLWGATGRDDKGNVYFGLSSSHKNDNTAYLYMYQPKYDQFIYQGNVIEQLEQQGLSYQGNSQNKIHSKIVQADDGMIYFASFDERGESTKTGALPTHGGHLWRKQPESSNWEHLAKTKHPLIAIQTAGHYVYGLGYWDHVLYQFDTRNQKMRTLTVGASLGHVSRNFFVNAQGDVFVPQVHKNEAQAYESSLEHYNSKLELVNSYPMPDYVYANKNSQHGIISFTNMANDDIYFVTGTGALYELSRKRSYGLKPSAQDSSLASASYSSNSASNSVSNNAPNNRAYSLRLVEFIGDSELAGTYAPSLFTIDGDDFLVIFGKQPGQAHYHWFIHQISTQTTVSYPLPDITSKQLLYGSVTRDDLGNFYVVGQGPNKQGDTAAVIFQLSYD